jgi:hypothetical protein
MPSGRPDTKGIDIDHPAGDEEETAEDEEPSEEAGGEDDEEYNEGIEEVEAEEVAADEGQKPSKRRPAAGRASSAAPEEKPGSGRRIWAIVIAILIIIPVIGLAYFFYGPSGEIQKIDLIAQPYTDNAGISGMSLVVQVDTGKPSHLSGTAELTVVYKDAPTYTGTVGISESQGFKSIPLSQFAIGNGEYTVQAKFLGKTSSTTFTESQIIEKVNVTAYNITRMSNSTIGYGTARMGITVLFLSNSSVSQMAIATDKLDIEITGGGGTSKYAENVASKMQLNVNYSVPGNGNYTVKVTFQNSKVRTGSQYSTIAALAADSRTNQPYVMVFMPPKAEAGPDQTVQWKLVDGGGKVTLDGSNSIAYGGAVVEVWTWDLNDGNIADGKTVTYIFKERTKYPVILLIMDNNGNTDTDICNVTVV